MSTPGLTASGSSIPFMPLLFNPNNDQAAQAAAQARALAAAQAAAAAAEAAARAAQQAAAAAAKKAAASRQAADEADARKKASASDLAQKKATLEDAKRDDLKAGRDPATHPSAATVKAQADYDAAGQQDAIVNPPAGADDPLATAQADTAARFRTFVGATESGDQAQAKAAQGAWLDAVQHQMQVAALEAGAKGQDQKAQVQAQLDGVLKAVDKDGTFDSGTLRKALQPATDQIGATPPDQVRAGMAYQSENDAGQARIAALQGQVKDLQAKADAADAAAAPPKVYGPYVPGHAPSQPSFTTASGNGSPVLATTAQQEAAAAHDALDAAKDKLASLEAVYGHTDPSNGRNDTIGTLRADYDADCATSAAAQAKAAWLKLAGAPGTSAKDLSAAYDAWQRAVDRQMLALKLQDATHASAALLAATQDRTAAEAALKKQPTSPFFATTTTSFGQTGLLVSDDAPAGAQTPQQRVASANAAFAAATRKSQDAQAALDQAWTDQKGGPQGMGLDISGTIDHADDLRAAVDKAQTDLSAAQSEFDAAQFGRPGALTLDDARTRLGLAQQAVDLAQAKVKVLDAMQALRGAQMATDGGAPPANLDTLEANVRDAQKAVDTLQGTRLVTADDRKTLTTTTLPAEAKTLVGIDAQIKAARDKGDTGSKDLRSLLDQRDWLEDKITLQKSAIALEDAQDAASAASYEYGRSTRPSGVDLTATGHGDEADAALTWGITPGGPGGQPRISGLPSNIKASDVRIEKDGDTWVAVFDKDSGAYAVRWTGGRFPVRTYADGSKQGDIAIEKGHKFKLDPATARLWEATNTDPAVGRSAIVVAKDNFDKALAQFKLDPQTDDAGKPVLGPDGRLSTAMTTDVAGQSVAAIDFNTDQTAAKTAADANVAMLDKALAAANAAASAAPADATLKAAQARAQSDYDLARSNDTAIGAVLDWQHARLARQIEDADTRDGRAGLMCYATPPRQTQDRLYQVAVSKVTDWRSLQQKVAVGGAQHDVDVAQAAFDQWHGAHSYLSAESVDASPQYQALQAAHGRLDVARRDLTLAATTDADARQKAYIAQNLAPGKQGDPRSLYQLFNQDPQVMAQSIINQDYIRNGSVAQAYAGRDAIGKMVSGELLTNADATRTIVDQIVAVGGDDAKVTIIPVVYAMNADADQGGGIVKTALFKVQDGSDPNSFKFVDAYGERYDSVDDYRANNNLPVDGVKLAMPKDGNITLDADGNVQLFTGDARTETGWQHFTRVTDFNAVVGVVGLVAGVVMEVGSAGILTEIAAPLAIASTAYLAGTSAQDLANRSQHGLSIDPFTNREAGLDWLNLGASALALPGLGSAARVSGETAELTRAGAQADSIAVVTSKGRALLRNGTDVTDHAEDYHLIAGSTTMTNATRTTAGVMGGAAMADQTIDVAQNWSTMTSAERQEQGEGLLLNVGMMLGAHAAGRIAGARAARGVRQEPSLATETTTLATDASAPPGHDDATGLGTATPDMAIDAARVGYDAPEPEEGLVGPGWYLQTMKRAAMDPAVRAKIAERLAEHNGVTPEEAAPQVEQMFGTGADVDVAFDTPALQPIYLGLVRDALGELEHDGHRVALDGYAPANAPWADTYAIRPSRPPQLRTAADLASALENTTRHAGRIAAAIKAGDMKVELLDHDTYVTTHAAKDRDSDSPLAFTQGHTIYLDLGRGGAGERGWALLLDAVHEGTHALDNLSGYDVDRPYAIRYKGRTLATGTHAPGVFHAGDQEARAYFHQLEFARALGLSTETFGEAEFPATLPEGTFGAGDGMEDIHAHIQMRYPNALKNRARLSAAGMDQPPIEYQHGSTTRGAAPTPPRAPAFKAARMRLPEHAKVDIDTMDWSTRALQADAESTAGTPPPLALAHEADAAIAGALRSDPAAGSKDFFVVSRRGPGRAIADGLGVDTSKRYATFDEAVAAVGRNRNQRDGAWVHRVGGGNVDPARLAKGKGAHLDAGDIAGSIFVDGQRQPTALVVANPAAAAWTELAPAGSAARPGGALVQPGAGVRTLADADAVVAHADELVAQYRPGSGRMAPKGSAPLVDALRQSRLTGARTRFVFSDKPPSEVFADGTTLHGQPGFRSFGKASAAAQEGGGGWVYRAELPQLRSKGQPVQWNVVGGLHVYDDGSVMPVGVARADAAAWTRPGALRVAGTAATGVLAFAGAAWFARELPLNVVLPFGLPHDTLTLAAVGTMVRSAAKVSRFGHAGRWQSRFADLQDTAGRRADFESALRQLDALDGRPGTRKLSQAVADFRAADRALSVTKTKARGAAIRAALGPLREAAGAPGDTLMATLSGHVDAKAAFDAALDRHATFLSRITDTNGSARARRFVAGMHDNVDDQGTPTGPVTRFRQQFGDVQGALVAWERDGPAALPDDALKAGLKEAVDQMHVAPELRKGATPVRRVLDGVQFTTYAIAWGASLHGVSGETLSQAASWGFNAAFAADAVRIAGVRFAGLLDRKLSDGATRTASSKLYTQWLPGFDDTLTTAAGLATLGNGVQDLMGLHMGAKGLVARHAFTWVHDLRVGVTGAYAGVNGVNWGLSASRRFGDPAAGDARGRRVNFWLKVGTGAAAAVLVADGILQKAVASNSPQNANDPNGNDRNHKPGGQPTPGPSPSSTPGLPVPSGSATATPTTRPGPSTSGKPPTGPSTSPAAPRPTHAQVIVAAVDPRRDTLWGIARDNEDTLLTTGRSAAVRAAGGGRDAQTLVALDQLFQLDPQRGFRPERMEGVASAQAVDPDTWQPSWRIDVHNPAVS
ncbi:MAG TPA: DUF4781 domain-containing protein [Burkholderiaceae bacterium]